MSHSGPCVMCGKETGGTYGGQFFVCFEHYEDGSLADYLAGQGIAKPDCYRCVHRRRVPGDEHSSCHHPATKGAAGNTRLALLAVFAGIGRHGPVIDGTGARELGIVLDEHGVQNGWANWPWSFDPIWLKVCLGFDETPS